MPVTAVTFATRRRLCARRGFTLVEMTVVISVLALMAALVVPNMVAIKRSQDLRDLEASLLRAPAEARNEARKTRQPVTLRVEGDALVMERGASDEEEEAEEVKRVVFGERLRIESAQIAGEPIDVASWQWAAYPDGSADTGGLEFVEGEARKSLVLSGDRSARWVEGELPQMTEDRWPAGELEQRGGQAG